MANSKKTMNAVVAALACSLLALGCGESGEEKSASVKAELDGHINAATTIYHLGCDQQGACSQAKRKCGADIEQQIVTARQAGKTVLIEWENRQSIVGIVTHFWLVAPDGSGVYYWEARTDIDGSDCGSYCGWHREQHAAGELGAADGSVTLQPYKGATMAKLTTCML